MLVKYFSEKGACHMIKHTVKQYTKFGNVIMANPSFSTVLLQEVNMDPFYTLPNILSVIKNLVKSKRDYSYFNKLYAVWSWLQW